jgi:acyl-CoA dehydrogenase
LGGKLKQKELTSARLGDVLSQLYICSAMLGRFEAQGRPAADLPILAWAIHDAIYKMQTALGNFADNFPNPWLRGLLKLVIFPLGRREKYPGDRLGHKVAQLLMSPSETRSRLTNGIYTSASQGHPIGIMEEALPHIIATEPLERKILKAQKDGQLNALNWEDQLQQALDKKIISNEEAAELRHSRKLTLEIIAVDEFESSALCLGEAASEEIKAPHAA